MCNLYTEWELTVLKYPPGTVFPGSSCSSQALSKDHAALFPSSNASTGQHLSKATI